MRGQLIGLLLLASSPAWAGQAEEIARQAGPCWAIPAGLETPPSVEFNLVLGDDGSVKDATAIHYSPKGKDGKEVALSALRALQACGPYKGASGTISVTMNAKTAFGGNRPIDPFK
jgi:hypothetical protein